MGHVSMTDTICMAACL